MTDGDDHPGTPDFAGWLRRRGILREVFGYAEAVAILGDSRAHVQFLELFEALGVDDADVKDLVAASLLSINGDEHRRLRAAVAAPFTPRAVEAVRGVAHDEADRLVTAAASAGRCEFVSEFATPYVQRCTAHHIGFPADDIGVYWDAVTRIAVMRSAEDFGRALLELVTYARSILQLRRVNPADDVVSLLAGRVDDGALPERVALTLVATLLSAGHEPTINQLGITVSLLAGRPDVWDAIAGGDVSPRRAVEAVLRYRSTNQGVLRRLAEPFGLGGVTFGEGETLLVNTGAANHDARQFVAPDELGFDDDAGAHLAFGFGEHFCLGAALARVQLQEAVAVMTQRLSCPRVIRKTEIEGDRLVGPSSLLLSVSPR